MKKQTKRNNTRSAIIELLICMVEIVFIYIIASWIYADIESGNYLKRYHYIEGGDQVTIGCDGKFIDKKDLPKDGLKCSLSKEANQND